MPDKRTINNTNWRQTVLEDVECEGFEYAFLHYDDYKWVNDEEFQKRLSAFREARKKLAEYVGAEW